MTEIKICGIRTTEEAGYLNEAGADYAGCVFYEPSKRYVTYDKAKEIISSLDPKIKKVAVTVSPDAETISAVQEIGFDILQVHNELSKEVLQKTSIPIWYACNISDENEMTKALEFMDEFTADEIDKIEGILMDAPGFGSGKTFDWNISDIPAFRKSRRLLKAGAQSPPLKFILAGGLKPSNVARGIEIFKPDVVDVSSGVEGDNGKDRDKIMAFVDAVRNRRWQ